MQWTDRSYGLFTEQVSSNMACNDLHDSLPAADGLGFLIDLPSNDFHQQLCVQLASMVGCRGVLDVFDLSLLH